MCIEILNPTTEDVCLRKCTHVGLAVRMDDATMTPLSADHAERPPSQHPPPTAPRTAPYAPTPAPRTAPRTAQSAPPTAPRTPHHVPTPAPRTTAPRTAPYAHARSSRTLPPLKPELQTLVDDVQAPVNAQERDQLVQLLHRNQDVFATKDQPLGRTDLVLHDINTGDAAPIKQRVRRPPIHQKDQAQAEVDRMLAEKVITPSQSPWASPVVLVRKKDGTVRYCVDYRQLNAVTRKDSYPLPRIDDSLESLGKARYFSTLDLASGYWQVGLTEAAKEKSAFCTTSGLYQFNVMPFGLANAPATFQRLMERVLTGLQWEVCLVYLDDVIVFSSTMDEHLSRLAQVFDKFRAAGLKLKPSKCHLLQRQVQYLGHVVSQDGIQTDPEKTRAVEEWPIPRSVGDVRSFMGLCSYYRRFVPDFSTVAKPLASLTEKNSVFRWEEKESQAFHQLKHRLTTAPILAYPDPDQPFILDTDASDVGIGAVLSQRLDGAERVIAYGSRTLTKSERRYCVTRRELLAVVHFVKYYRHFLSGAKFLLRTDHAPLRWLRSFKEPDNQLARWLETLEAYDFDLQHRPGIKHGNAGAMSRGPCPHCDGPHDGTVIRKGRARREAAPSPEVHASNRARRAPTTSAADKKAAPSSKVTASNRARRAPAPRSSPAARGKPDASDSTRRQPPPDRARPVMTRQRRRQMDPQTPASTPDSNWLSTLHFNRDTLRSAQDADPDVSTARQWIQARQRPPFQTIVGEGPYLKFLHAQFPALEIHKGLVI